MNLIDKTISAISPSWGLQRQISRIKSQYLNTVEPLKPNRRSKSPIHGFPTTSDHEVNKYDRKYMINLVRIMSRENPLMSGIIQRIAANVVPYDGIRPTPITDDKEFNKAAEEYFFTSAEECEITGRFDFAVYQDLLLQSVLRDGDFGSILTNRGKLQGIEADRIMSPSAYASDENRTLFQGVKIDTEGKPMTYYIGNRNIMGVVLESDFRGIQARNFIHSFRPDRIDGYRGIPVFLPVLDHMRDIQDIITYEKFAIKMASAMGIKIIPKDGGGNGLTNIPGLEPIKNEQPKQQITDLFAGQIFDLERMGAKDVQVVDHNRPGSNFINIITFLSQMVGVGIGLPLELVLLDFHRGNMASIRLALLEARRTFFRHYKIVKDFSKRYYRWTLDNAIADGVLKVPDKIQNHYYRAEWTEPSWPYMDPLSDIEADAKAIAYGLSTFDEIAKKKNKNWARIAEQLAYEHQFFKDKNVPVVIGNPGSKTTLETDPKTKGKQNEPNSMDPDNE